jgi:hypothetical protein
VTTDNFDFFITFGLGPLALFAAGAVVFVMARREQHRYFGQRAMRGHTPAE